MKLKNLISTLLIIFIIIILLNICYSKFILKDNLIKLFKTSYLIVGTGSMEPEIKPGELIIIAEKNTYKEGDIVTYQDEENYLITHRIIQINKDKFISKGDANNLLDEESLISNIEGKVIFHSKILGFFVLYLLKPLVIIYIIIFIILNIILYKKEAKDIEEEKSSKDSN